MPVRVLFTAAQAAQKSWPTALIAFDPFTAAQAAQKNGHNSAQPCHSFTAAQAAQKHRAACSCTS